MLGVLNDVQVLSKSYHVSRICFRRSIWFTTDDARLDLELCVPPSSNIDAGLDCQISSFVLSLRRLFSCGLEAISSADSFDKQKPLIMALLQKHCHLYSWQWRRNHLPHYGQILQCHWTFENTDTGFHRSLLYIW